MFHTQAIAVASVSRYALGLGIEVQTDVLLLFVPRAGAAKLLRRIHDAVEIISENSSFHVS